MDKQFYVYILSNKLNTVLYIGVTSNLEKRLWEHRNKVTRSFTQKYNVDNLVYFEVFDDSITAIAREKSLKNLVRRKKDALISAQNPTWKDLSSEILSPVAPE